jgi:hypothetical protein
MVLKVDLSAFLDEKGNVLTLTKQADKVFKFITKIVSSVSENIEQPLINIDLRCNTRADKLSCEGSIDAKNTTIDMIEWHCDTCEASGTILNWQASLWDKQDRTIH